VTITAIRKMDIDYIGVHFLPILCKRGYVLPYSYFINAIEQNFHEYFL